MSKVNFDPICYVEDDGYIIPDVGIWSEEKYKLVGGYCDIFTKGMRRSWDNLVYVDLFAGAGLSRIRETNKIIKSSPLISLSIPTKFDNYIFCEQEKEKYSALVARTKDDKNVKIFNEDTNLAVEKICDSIPQYSKTNTVLTFCFVDPYSLNLEFSTIKKLSENRRIDFLILQALHMDANRNLKPYINENSNKIEKYLGNPRWRTEFGFDFNNHKSFVKFLADQYDERMKDLGYLKPHRHLIKLPGKNVSLYYLTFYSKHERGKDFFSKVEKYSTDQFSLGI